MDCSGLLVVSRSVSHYLSLVLTKRTHGEVQKQPKSSPNMVQIMGSAKNMTVQNLRAANA